MTQNERAILSQAINILDANKHGEIGDLILEIINEDDADNDNDEMDTYLSIFAA